MAWTPPKQDWNANDIVTAAHMNAIGANLTHLKSGRFAGSVDITGATTNSASFINIVTLDITTHGGVLLVGAYAGTTHTASGNIYYDIALNGTRRALGGANGSLELRPSASAATVALLLLYTDVSAGNHTLTLQWRTSGAWAYLHPGQFWAVEV